jgi:hypothetical protein
MELMLPMANIKNKKVKRVIKDVWHSLARELENPSSLLDVLIFFKPLIMAVILS